MIATATPLSVRPGEQPTVRRATPADAAAIIGLYERLSPQSRFTRFFHPTPRIDGALRALLVDIERVRVWLAFDGDTCIGEARVAQTTGEPCAELAVTIADRYQHNGLGQQLARLAVNDHLEASHCVSFSILPTNTAATRLARRNHLQLNFHDRTLDGQINPPPTQLKSSPPPPGLDMTGVSDQRSDR